MNLVPSDPDAPAPLRVLIGHRPPAPITRHIDQIVGDNLSEIDFGFFAGAYRGQETDILHVLDAEILLSGSTPEERVDTATTLIEQLREQGSVLVQTVIGSPTDEQSADPARNLLNDATAAFIVLDESVETPAPERTTLIPHGHFREKFLGYPRGEEVPGRLLCISRSQLSRAAEGPLKALTVTDTPGLTLRVVGNVSPRLQTVVERSQTWNPTTVSVRDETLSDAEIIREIDSAELVVLPEIETLTDAAMLFMTLSLDRPALVRDSESARLLAESVGDGWVLRYDGPLTAEILDQKVEELRSAQRAVSPNLKGRDIETTMAKYAEVYNAAARVPAAV